MINIENRNELPKLLDSIGLNNNGVEVGVACGAYSSIILRNSNLKLLYSVDNWKKPRIKSKAERQLAKFGTRNRILHMTSDEASRKFYFGSLDFVYIDADHVYKSVKQDLELWYDKVKVGGVFAGHDYVDRTCKYGVFGVKQAVNEMAKKYNQKIFVTNERWKTWWIIKE